MAFVLCIWQHSFLTQCLWRPIHGRKIVLANLWWFYEAFLDAVFILLSCQSFRFVICRDLIWNVQELPQISRMHLRRQVLPDEMLLSRRLTTLDFVSCMMKGLSFRPLRTLWIIAYSAIASIFGAVQELRSFGVFFIFPLVDSLYIQIREISLI